MPLSPNERAAPRVGVNGVIHGMLVGRMLKSDLVWSIWHQNQHLLFRDAEKIVDALFDEITRSLARGKRIELRGFGTFSLRVWEARTGRNPRTGVSVLVPKKVLPRFRVAKQMRERLNREASS
jgi:integration host factor subunit beta